MTTVLYNENILQDESMPKHAAIDEIDHWRKFTRF